MRVGPLETARAVLDAIDRGERLAVVTRLDGDRPGARLLVSGDRVNGALGDSELERSAIAAARAALTHDAAEPGPLTLESDDGPARVLLEVHRPVPRLIIVGAGHIAVPLSRIAATAGFDVSVLDDRDDFTDASRFPDAARVLRTDFADPFAAVRPGAADYVVLVTRAHRYDFDCLRRLLEGEPLPRYIGMIGSRRRVRAAFGALLEAGVARDRLRRVRAPLGLDIGAETPEEIAVSVVAEMIAERRGVLDRDAAGAPLSSREAIVDRFFEVPA